MWHRCLQEIRECGGDEMVTKHVVLAAACAVSCSFAWPAQAQETGLDSLHAQVRLGGRICMLDHFHNGSSSGQASRKQAEAAAIASWADFTVWEYGPPWGSWRLAETKRVSCAQTGGSWACTLEARPCKPAGRRGRR
jgi:hypothetical protein